MDIKLKKGNETITMKYGPTLFPVALLAPFIGLLLALFLWFRRGQHKEFFSQLIILLLIILFSAFSGTVLYRIIPQMAAGLWFVSGVGWIVAYVYFMASSVKNANMWRLKTLIKLGYEPENEQIYNLALAYKKPKWMFFSSF